MEVYEQATLLLHNMKLGCYRSRGVWRGGRMEKEKRKHGKGGEDFLRLIPGLCWKYRLNW
jgi:hypothetical protein